MRKGKKFSMRLLRFACHIFLKFVNTTDLTKLLCMLKLNRQILSAYKADLRLRISFFLLSENEFMKIIVPLFDDLGNKSAFGCANIKLEIILFSLNNLI